MSSGLARTGARAAVVAGLAVLLVVAFAPLRAQESPAGPVLHPDEVRLANLRQLTFGGENAEAYWSPDGTKLIFQSSREGTPCDQEFVLDVATKEVRRVSNGQGTHDLRLLPRGRPAGAVRLHPPRFARVPAAARLLEGLRLGRCTPGYDLFTAKADGSDLQRLTSTPGYDAEATVSPDGETIVFTSVRDGDLEIYTMALDGSGVKRLTREPGYDGGAFFSPDGRRIVYRRDAPRDEAGLARYRSSSPRGSTLRARSRSGSWTGTARTSGR